MLCLHEKGGKEHRVPVHHQLVEYLETYLDAAGLREETEQGRCSARRAARPGS